MPLIKRKEAGIEVFDWFWICSYRDTFIFVLGVFVWHSTGWIVFGFLLGLLGMIAIRSS